MDVLIKLEDSEICFLRHLAVENNMTAEWFASRIIEQALAEYRDEIRWTDWQEQQDLIACHQEKIVEETLDF
jgi:hypothetical protein